MKTIIEELKELSKSDLYPFHMPGHKRNQESLDMSEYMDIDITEIDGYDNLHDASGIIQNAQNRANRLYFKNKLINEQDNKFVEAETISNLDLENDIDRVAIKKEENKDLLKEESKDLLKTEENKYLSKIEVNSDIVSKPETFFLVNGSTSGVLAAVSAAVKEGGKLLTGRNAHKALYNAAYLRRLELLYLTPNNLEIPEGGIVPGKINPEEVQMYLRNDNAIEAVFITSPTYEGVSSDIRKIANICHDYKKILIVDAAHGAHFGLYKDLPENAVSQGADIVIHSVHKTLASMTQTALLHVQGSLVNRQRLRRFLRIYQSSSPSYVLMSSIDSCIGDIENRGDEIFQKLIDYRRKIQQETRLCKNIFVPDIDVITDPCKVLVCARNGFVTGQEIYDILRVEYRLQPEMAGVFYALMIITGYDSEQGIDRLIKAIKDMDLRFSKIHMQKGKNNREYSLNQKTDIDKYPKTIIPMYEAWDAEHEMVDIALAAGRVSGDFINLYPPGIPLIVPGEIFTKELLDEIEEYIDEDMNMQGVEINRNSDRKVTVLKNN